MILPETAETRQGHLYVGGCDTVELAKQFGTPLYLFDEATLHARVQAYRRAFADCYPSTLLCYAAKAFINPWLARLLADEGWGLDVVSGGEIMVAHVAGFPMANVHFHGNNKLLAELELALDLGVGRIVIDNLPEIGLLEGLAAARGRQAQVWLRIAPGVEAHTHEYLRTGGTYSKFGIAVATDQAAQAVEQILTCRHLDLVGLHAHIGSQIFELVPYEETLATLLDFARQMRERYGLRFSEISPGGGLGIEYIDGDDPPSVAHLAAAVSSAVRSLADAYDMDLPKVVLEPGRSLIGQAGITLYTVGSIKSLPGNRTYVAVDGGMADNIRPALYGASFGAVVANKADSKPAARVAIVGKYCESGDVLIDDAELPEVQAGDVLAIPATGAYCIPLASNYNQSLRPPIVAVSEGRATLVRRRETYDDLLACEVR